MTVCVCVSFLSKQTVPLKGNTDFYYFLNRIVQESGDSCLRRSADSRTSFTERERFVKKLPVLFLFAMHCSASCSTQIPLKLLCVNGIENECRQASELQ